MGEDTKLLLMQNEVEYRRESMLQQHRDRLNIDGPSSLSQKRLERKIEQYEESLEKLSKMIKNGSKTKKRSKGNKPVELNG